MNETFTRSALHTAYSVLVPFSPTLFSRYHPLITSFATVPAYLTSPFALSAQPVKIYPSLSTSAAVNRLIPSASSYVAVTLDTTPSLNSPLFASNATVKLFAVHCAVTSAPLVHSYALFNVLASLATAYVPSTSNPLYV